MRERELGGEIQRDMHEEKKLCRAVEEIQQLPQQFSTGVWKELVYYFPHQEHVRSHDHRATFSRSLWELAASKTLEGQGFSPHQVFQMCCINIMCVPQHHKCIFHIKCNTDNYIVQIIPLIRNSSALLGPKHFISLVQFCVSFMLSCFFKKKKVKCICVDGHQFHS